MANDVSDEALRRLCEHEALSGWRATALFAFAKRIRDLTAARCVEVVKGCASDPEDIGYVENCARELLVEFPGAAAAEGEARDE